NVRELENLIERICLLEDGPQVELEHLPRRILRQLEEATARSQSPAAVAAPMPHALPAEQGYEAATADFQRALIRQALDRCSGQLSPAAESLGLSRHALRHQMRKLGITPTSP
ncbi:MAG: helix-turn-helix domain-containing protein, partial [Ramlibacter sp.]|uniref:helix-turn-helix domain-containing protein n=1 Tax=Ramlibacter sp. TaxID=1917967 RepID=UPI00261EC5C9